jgi:hypothetical protein
MIHYPPHRYAVGQVIGLGAAMPCEGRTIPPGVAVTVLRLDHRHEYERHGNQRHTIYINQALVRWERGRIVREFWIDEAYLTETVGLRLFRLR